MTTAEVKVGRGIMKIRMHDYHSTGVVIFSL
jgi:hypothetical protein